MTEHVDVSDARIELEQIRARARLALMAAEQFRNSGEWNNADFCLREAVACATVARMLLDALE